MSVGYASNGRGIRALGAALTAIVLLAACGTVITTPAGSSDKSPSTSDSQQRTASTGSVEEPTAGSVTGFPECTDERPSADPAVYRDTPHYGNADTVIDPVRAWAAGQEDFEELWLDRERNGWITLGFSSGDIDALQQQVEDDFPGEGIAVVRVPHTQQELTDLQQEVMRALGGSEVVWHSMSADVVSGRVGIGLVYLTPEAEAVLERFRDEPLCVGVLPAEAFVPEGPQPSAGEGWRLLGQGLTGQTYRTGVATTPEQLTELWAETGVRGAIPQVDFESEVAIWFGAVYGSGQEIRMDRVVVDGDTVHGDFVVPGPQVGGHDDANPHAYVVALDRDLLPEGPFRVQLDADDPPRGALEERTMVDVDLSAPGSTATDEQLHADPDAGPRVPEAVEDGDTIEAGERVAYSWQVDRDCGLDLLGTFNGTRWRLADGSMMPQEMKTLADEGELEVTLDLADESTLLVSNQVTDLIYVPAPDGYAC